MEHALILLVALVLDAVLGEPAWLWSKAPHPRVLMIRLCNFLRDLLSGRFEPRLPGAIALGALALAAGLLGWGLMALSPFGLLEVVVAVALIGHRDVLDRLGGVERGLAEGPEEAARAVSRVARRGLAPMNADMTARTAIELSAAHFADRFVAPVFWFLLFNLPGLCIVYVVDVARRVWAQDEAEEEGFGWAAFRLDELIKWIPGRIAGWALVAAALPRNAWDVMMDDSAIHRSGYAGWPVAAAAGALDVALAGPRPAETVVEAGAEAGAGSRAAPYINRNGRRELGAFDIGALCGLLWRGWAVVMVFLALLAAPLVLF